MSHESDSASRHRNMLKSLRVDIPHVGALMPAIGFVRQPPLGRLCETLEYVNWFNHRRLHGEIGMIPPAELEATHYHESLPVAVAGTQ